MFGERIWLGWFFCKSVSYVKSIPTHEKKIAVGKSGPHATFNLFFLGLGWPWVGEFDGFIIIFICFATQHNVVWYIANTVIASTLIIPSRVRRRTNTDASQAQSTKEGGFEQRPPRLVLYFIYHRGTAVLFFGRNVSDLTELSTIDHWNWGATQPLHIVSTIVQRRHLGRGEPTYFIKSHFCVRDVGKKMYPHPGGDISHAPTRDGNVCTYIN